MRRNLPVTLGAIFLIWVSASGASAQFAAVTLALDTNRINVGQSTLLHVFAQITPAQRAATERVFSWNIDLINSSPDAARPDFAGLRKPASDNEPRTSSTGVSEGGNRRGIYDTFLDRPGAGREAPIELFSVPSSGLSGGRALFRVIPGSLPDGPDAD